MIFISDIRLGNSLDDINLEDLCEFAEQLDVYLDLRVRLNKQVAIVFIKIIYLSGILLEPMNS